MISVSSSGLLMEALLHSRVESSGQAPFEALPRATGVKPYIGLSEESVSTSCLTPHPTHSVSLSLSLSLSLSNKFLKRILEKGKNRYKEPDMAAILTCLRIGCWSRTWKAQLKREGMRIRSHRGQSYQAYYNSQ